MFSNILVIAKDFNSSPAGRYRDYGDFSGERFREDFLLPRLKKFERVIVDFDGLSGVSSSFLEEAFGGLVHCGYYSPEELLEKLLLVGNDDFTIIPLVWKYVKKYQKLN